jgi:hypothetical protein
VDRAFILPVLSSLHCLLIDYDLMQCGIQRMTGQSQSRLGNEQFDQEHN